MKKKTSARTQFISTIRNSEPQSSCKFLCSGFESSNLKFLKLTHVFGTLTPMAAGWLVCLFSWKDPGLSSLLLRSFTFSLWVSLSSSPAMKRAFWLTANPLKGTGPLSSSSPPPLLLPLSPPPQDTPFSKTSIFSFCFSVPIVSFSFFSFPPSPKACLCGISLCCRDIWKCGLGVEIKERGPAVLQLILGSILVWDVAA